MGGDEFDENKKGELIKELEKHSEFVKELQMRMKPKRNRFIDTISLIVVCSFCFMPMGLSLAVLGLDIGMKIFIVSLIWFIWSIICVGLWGD